jgi:hypothetical protein
MACRGRLGQHQRIDMEKAVKGSAIEPIKANGEGLLGLKSHTVIHR